MSWLEEAREQHLLAKLELAKLLHKEGITVNNWDNQYEVARAVDNAIIRIAIEVFERFGPPKMLFKEKHIEAVDKTIERCVFDKT